MLDAAACFRSGVVLSLSFLLIFSAYSATEVLETSIIPSHCSGCVEGPANGTCQSGFVCQHKAQFACDVACEAPYRECKSSLGDVVMGTMYLMFMTSAMAGPFLPHYLGEKKSMVGSSTIYGVFALANLVVASNPTNVVLQWAVMIPTACVVGIAASFLWISQASYLTRLSVQYSQFKGIPAIASVGLFSGMFNAFFKLATIVGNTISSIVLNVFGWSTVPLFWIYTLVSAAGTALLCLVPDLPIPHAAPLPTESTKLLVPESPVTSIQSLAALAVDKRMLALAPIMILNGFQQGFLSGEFTANVVRDSLGSSAIGTVFVVVGLVSVASSIVMGKLADKCSPLPGQLVSFVVLLAAYIMCFVVTVSKCDEQWHVVLTIGVLLSIGDALVLGQEFPDDPVNAFSLFRVYHAGATSISFFLFPSLTFHGRLALLMALIVVSAVAYIVYYMRFRFVR
ncbi:hypothetical protein, variant 1 [Aphanomyces invadans]|uniref:Major facilitator superfamily (MFS) profile domain-containing protein n=1 Tax=Aphanomyces invadans TaxID=157072 RepID=A0A024UUK6_9STRA|nr:hypothetical protein, variant 1 [Aphanomyces invadans]ETW09640.1 hypothetical protein, variant 1 [Aphanomyces invadans]|eukprot:XP_008861053.1 hypothetical protein, variant 1 [Aphanomyces invadans]